MLGQLPKLCIHCQSGELFARRIDTNMYMPLLAGAGGIMGVPFMHVVVCADCGYMMLFADKQSCDRVRHAGSGWLPLDAE